MPAQHETQADAITRLIETIARLHGERDIQTTAIARLLDDNNALAAKLAPLRQAVNEVLLFEGFRPQSEPLRSEQRLAFANLREAIEKAKTT